MATPSSPTCTCSKRLQEESRVPTPDEGPEVNAVAMQRPPPFQKENPVVWFGLLEAAMNLSKLTNDVTKYYYVISSLDPSTANLIADIIMSPPPVDKYKTVNVRLMKLFGQSEKTRAQESLRTCRMGDEKPSHFLQRLRGLAAATCWTPFSRASSWSKCRVRSTISSWPAKTRT